MSSFTDSLLRLMGYIIIFIMIVVVGIAAYIAYQLMFSNGFNLSNEKNNRVMIEKNINSDLNEKNVITPSDTLTPTDNDTAITYTSPESEVPSYSTYNPFDDNNIPVTEPTTTTIGSVASPQPSESDDVEKAPKPLDPTNKNQQPDLNLLF